MGEKKKKKKDGSKYMIREVKEEDYAELVKIEKTAVQPGDSTSLYASCNISIAMEEFPHGFSLLAEKKSDHSVTGFLLGGVFDVFFNNSNSNLSDSDDNSDKKEVFDDNIGTFALLFHAGVLPEFRGQGIAGMIIEDMVNRMERLKAEGALYCIFENNEASNRMGEKLRNKYFAQVSDLKIRIASWPLLSKAGASIPKGISLEELDIEDAVSITRKNFDLVPTELSELFSSSTYFGTFQASDGDGNIAALSVWDRAQVMAVIPESLPFHLKAAMALFQPLSWCGLVNSKAIIHLGHPLPYRMASAPIVVGDPKKVGVLLKLLFAHVHNIAIRDGMGLFTIVYSKEMDELLGIKSFIPSSLTTFLSCTYSLASKKEPHTISSNCFIDPRMF